MLGDVAVAVHPDDERYINFIGKNVIHPFNGCVLPIISDDTVDPKFGTGGVKITPAHDPRDFLIAKRHNLPTKTVINENGYLSDKCFDFSGIHRFHARQTLIKVLEEKGLLRSIKPHSFQLPIWQPTSSLMRSIC
ncbi:uncharacterized protein LOC106673821 [Cimex lectularius]|uniref:valine--tRNA ligase n=1 Tax=Cimex lectularius TaxID=79782 RepID=A0A8I6SKP7_CIMLE|nr:uncharacterized protein LOC106673821 [Cimex lectularius]